METEEQISTYRRPYFFVLSIVMFVLSVGCQIYFFVVLNDILSAKENGTEVLQAIFEWIYLVAPSLTLASMTFGVGAIAYLISWLRRESGGIYRSIFGVAVCIEATLFLLVFAFGYR
jgi:hypothetical protein